MKKLFDDFQDFILSLKNEGLLVIVEGKKDVKALNEFGVECVSLRGDLKSFCERISQERDEVVLLMDTDKEGRELTKKLRTYFSVLGVKVNLFYWNCLKKLRITHVEGLSKKSIDFM